MLILLHQFIYAIDVWMGNNITCGEELQAEPELLIPVEDELAQKGKEKIKHASLQLLASPPQITEQLAQTIICQKPFQIHHQHSRHRHIFKLNQTHIYQGQINENNHPHGLGRIYRQDGTVQIGQFQHSIAIGQHYLFMPDGSFYLGTIHHATIPYGYYKAKDFTYNGQFREYEFHGKGKENHKDYDFEGEYEDGQRVQGVLKWRENNFTNVFRGRFNIFGEFQGQGKLLTREGIYKGSFRNGLKEGYGVFQYSNGLTYEGSYLNGQRAGKGRIINSNQSICYEGEFQDGLPHGWGKSCDQLGNIWQGQFKCGIAAGFYDSLPAVSL